MTVRVARRPGLTGTKPLVECVGYARPPETCVTSRGVVRETEALLQRLAHDDLDGQRRTNGRSDRQADEEEVRRCP
ncbi:MAG TPA: hypothetical protein VER39_07780 [Nocardioidaceae bacterium]|nr:hypothetical protein [Nocardioidaceae bacterium]